MKKKKVQMIEIKRIEGRTEIDCARCDKSKEGYHVEFYPMCLCRDCFRDIIRKMDTQKVDWD